MADSKRPSDDLDDIFNFPPSSKNNPSVDFDPEEIFRPPEPPKALVSTPLKQGPPPVSEGPLVFTIKLPSKTAWHPSKAQSLFNSLLMLGELTFRIIYQDDVILWQIIDLSGTSAADGAISAAIRSQYPDAELQFSALSYPIFSQPYTKLLIPFSQRAPFYCPSKYVEDIPRDHDPLAVLAACMNLAQPGEQVSYIVHTGKVDQSAYKKGIDGLTQGAGINSASVSTGVWNMVRAVFVDRGWISMAVAGTFQVARGLGQSRLKVQKFDDATTKIFVDKLSRSQLYETLMFLEIDVVDQQRIGQFISSFSVLNHEFVTDFQFLDGPANESLDNLVFDIRNQQEGIKHSATTLLKEIGRLSGYKSLFNVSELAALWHLPHENFTASKIMWRKTSVAMPSYLKGKTTGIQLGTNVDAGRIEAVYMLDEERATHINIVGKTGVGKSNLLHHLIHQDIENNKTVAVIDPHGTLVRDILQTSIPPQREQDVVVLDLANEFFPPPLNPLLGKNSRAELGRFVGILSKIYTDWEHKHRTANALTSALISIQAEQQPTVRDVAKLFINSDYRQQVLANVTDETALEFWFEEYENFSENQQLQIREPVVLRMRSFYQNPHLYPIICHPDTLDFGELVQQRKIILLSLRVDESQVPEREQALIGALVISQLQMAAMSMSRNNTHLNLYIDEVQNFVTSSLADLFSEARKFGVSLVVANQYLSQLAGSTLDAIMGNVGATIVFRSGLEDARTLAPYMKPGFTMEDLLNLDMYQAAVKMQYKGQTQPAFSLATDIPLRNKVADPDKCDEREARIRRLSVERYTPKSKAEIMAWLSKRYPRPGTNSGSEIKKGPSFYDIPKG